jgi:uncharacterized protein YrzB (UPF0473 family)
MENKVTIVNPKGQKVVADLITVFRSEETKQDYAIYTFNQKGEDNKIKDYVSRIRIDNGEYYFDTITDDKEWEIVKNIISKIEEGEM